MAANSWGRTQAPKFWKDQAQAIAQHASLKQMSEAIPSCHAPCDTSPRARRDLAAAADASSALLAAERGQRSAHALMCGDPGNAFNQKLKWLDTLRYAHARGAKRLHTLDAANPDGGHVVDVELALYAAELDVLDALAPSLRNNKLAEQAKDDLHSKALQAMADKDTRR
ncbi:hypothetical protein [Mycobacteroides abscessus]|uniref:hypothetical protein n=2 Tax=Mycobacteroides abscessus TaxID=36809 RepID=UPI00092704E5|nr:hypothetical protein [Mycobacteroides abscessus]SHQ48486.1 Uncharacterised protein [Mycobacteroides abscessus subsp. abscessus]SKQ85413.1 Uncharacterised protein [Mycobacteroides abscessus subsp. massiliense]SLC49056.1 Uncharacterised protein [Mycobacteroides abscessus subsp. massiliense]